MFLRGARRWILGVLVRWLVILGGVLRGLDEMGDEAVAGEVVFGDPGSERAGVLVRSLLMDSPGQLVGDGGGGWEDEGCAVMLALVERKMYIHTW